MTGSSLQELQTRIDGIEESYEFMLAYAAKGLSSEAGSNAGGLREFLIRTEESLSKLADLFSAVVQEEGSSSAAQYEGFIEVLRDDARKARAAVSLTLAQPAISSQLIDNLNASIHLRALLTDIFLLDEIISPRTPAGTAAAK